jgi:hypothetical protein
MGMIGVDHALSRAGRGLADILVVEGSPNLEIFAPMPEGGHASEGTSQPGGH